MLGVALAPLLATTGAALAEDPTGQTFIWNGDPTAYTADSQDWSIAGNWLVGVDAATVVPTLADVVELGYGPVYIYDGVDALAYSLGIAGEFNVNVGATLTVENGIVHTAPSGQVFGNGGEIYADITTSGFIYNFAGIEGDLVVNEGGYVFHQSEDDGRTLWIGDVDNAGTVYSNGADWEGDLKTNTSEIMLDGDATWQGDVRSNEGQIKLGNTANWTGDILGSTGTITLSGTATWEGDVSNDGELTLKNGSGWTGDVVANTEQIVLQNTSSWQGDVLTNEDEIRLEGSASWTGDIISSSGNVVLDSVDAEWHGDVLDSTGRINSKGSWYGSITGAGWLFLSGYVEGDIVNRETGDPDRGALFYAGDLEVGGSIEASGMFSLRETAGAQTVTAQSLTLTDGTWFEVDIDQSGNSDRVDIAGTATLAGFVYVGAASGDGYVEGMRYTILTAGSIEGGFDDVQSDLSFLTPVLSSDGTSVSIVLKRNDFSFAEGASARNDQTAAAAIQWLGAGNPLYEAALNLTNAELPHAFSGLAGDSHLATRSAVMAGGQVVADTLLSHINATFDALDTDASASAYAAAPDAPPDAAPASGAWGRLYGVRSEIAADDDLPGSTTTGGGIVGGVDTLVGDWRVGVTLHAGNQSTELEALDDSSATTSYGAGLYAGREWGDTRLLLGTAVAGHAIRSSRTVSLPEAATLEADYAAGTAMAFAELSHQFDLGALELTPRLGLSHVRYGDGGFAETGGAAALTVAASDVATTSTTLGLDIAHQFALGDGVLMTATGNLGWRHAFADDATGEHAFGEGPAFTVVGTPQAADALLLGAGLAVDLDSTTAIGLDYRGELAEGVTAHRLAGSWNARF